MTWDSGDCSGAPVSKRDVGLEFRVYVLSLLIGVQPTRSMSEP